MILGTFFNKQLNNETDRLISRTYNGYYENQSVDYIGWRAFGYNTNLTEVSLPNVTSLGYAPFIGCTGLLSAYIPNCTYVSEGAFSACTALRNVDITSCTYISQNAFSGCTNLSQLSIASWGDITFLGSRAFQNCNKLPISITNSHITTLYTAVFQACSSMTYASFPYATAIQQNAFTLCLASVIYAPNVTSFGAEALKQATSVKSLYFPAHAGALTNRTFESCYQATEIDIPMATNAPLFCFRHCSKLTSLKLTSCYNIGSGAFAGDINLSVVYFNWTSSNPVIGSTAAFQSCYNLLSLYLLGPNVMSLSNINAFTSTPISNYTTSTGGIQGSIYVPESLYSTYIASTNWVTYAARFVSLNSQEYLNVVGSWVSTISVSFTYPQSKAIYVSDGNEYLKNNCLSVTANYYDGTSETLDEEDYFVTGQISAGYNGRYAIKEQRGVFRYIATIDAELPEGYTRVGYLQTSGTQYIDTELLPEQNDQYVFEHTANDTTNGNGLTYVIGANPITGIRQSANYVEIFWAGAKVTSTAKYYAQNNGSGSNVAVGQSNVMSNYPNAVITYSKGEFSFTKTGTLPTISYYVFATNNNGTPDFGSKKIQRIWYVEIPNRLKLIPCIRNSDNTVGMYDLMGNICSLTNTPFFINAGTGSFTYGYNP